MPSTLGFEDGNTVIDCFPAGNITGFANFIEIFSQGVLLFFNAIALILQLKRGIVFLFLPLLSSLEYPTFFPNFFLLPWRFGLIGLTFRLCLLA